VGRIAPTWTPTKGSPSTSAERQVFL
jgi:hypothetical protein